ncbi:MAG: LacI family transcriptional regulator [Oscillospiraceae bacterium]|nr:LacI family transcriptional regulator [Oscillospiraceae bacterium]
MKTTTIADIASALGVSKASVSRAITGNGRISQQTRARILNYMDERNFRPNVIAQSLANLKTYNIAFTVPGRQEFGEIPFFQKCLIGVCEKALENGYDILVVTVDGDDISHMRRVVENGKVDGVVLSRNVDGDGMIGYLQSKGIPFVLVGTAGKPDVVQVDGDHTAACMEITSLFTKAGKIGLIGGNQRHAVNQNRYRGFRQAAGQSAPVVWDAVDYHSVVGAFEALRAEGARAVCCMDDIICTHALSYLSKMNINIPRDVEMVSFYSSWLLDTHSPPIPSLYFDVREQGAVACDLLLRTMAGEPVPKRTLKGHELLHCASVPGGCV